MKCNYGPHVMKVVATINNPIVLRDVSDEAIALAIALDEDFGELGLTHVAPLVVGQENSGKNLPELETLSL